MEPLQNDKKALGEISSLNLAYIGDGVYELMVRERLLRQGGRVRYIRWRWSRCGRRPRPSRPTGCSPS